MLESSFKISTKKANRYQKAILDSIGDERTHLPALRIKQKRTSVRPSYIKPKERLFEKPSLISTEDKMIKKINSIMINPGSWMRTPQISSRN